MVACLSSTYNNHPSRLICFVVEVGVNRNSVSTMGAALVGDLFGNLISVDLSTTTKNRSDITRESMVLFINDEYKQQVAYGFLGRWKVGVEPLSQLCLIGTWKVTLRFCVHLLFDKMLQLFLWHYKCLDGNADAKPYHNVLAAATYKLQEGDRPSRASSILLFDVNADVGRFDLFYHVETAGIFDF
ncbi:hypothetical protein OIU84_001563 [Salix udensis]|uniref:Uncharacterized protein n=1 Tax=Salix udensis TaxID=889485 RepID=A0AAD6P6R4_9ROSI|nr:hypothetical protein OIU84_001563 [Salix udensis]